MHSVSRAQQNRERFQQIHVELVDISHAIHVVDFHCWIKTG